MNVSLLNIFNEIPSAALDSSNTSYYATMSVPGYTNYFVGKDKDSLACLLISTRNRSSRPHPPIRYESLDAQFELPCRLTKVSEYENEGIFTVIRCRDSDAETILYFWSVCEMIIRMLGDNPTQTQVTTAVNRLAAIFQQIRRLPTRSLNGLFGELYLILRSSNAVRALMMWRIDQNSRFDFTDSDIRLDAKTSGNRSRIHNFSYDQCNPSVGTIAVVASLHAEQVAGGTSLGSIIDQIETRVSAYPDLVYRLHENVVATLGKEIKDGISRRFDMHLAESSLRFFNLEEVPAIRGPLPIGVSNVHFHSDLSSLTPLSIEELINRDPTFQDILPKQSKM